MLSERQRLVKAQGPNPGPSLASELCHPGQGRSRGEKKKKQKTPVHNSYPSAKFMGSTWGPVQAERLKLTAQRVLREKTSSLVLL